MSTIQAAGVNAGALTAGTTGEASREAAPPANSDLANQEVFLRLLVAQMQNQNPLSPADPIQFVTQLTQFSSLEQTIQIRQRLDAIYDAMLEPAPGARERAPDPASPKP
jgi:flagellar hook assembly protein FlgD